MKDDFPFRSTLCNSQLIFQDPEIRLNASSFPPEWIKAKKILEKITIEKLSTFTERVFVGARVKRLFVREEEGIPYLMPDDVFMFPLKPRKWVRKETQDIENWWVQPFTILVTQSGAAGRCLIVNKHFKDKLVSPNMIRIVLNNQGKEIIGFIYAFLNSTIGQTFLLKQQYGITVKHIEPKHIEEMPLPLLPNSDIKEINRKILEAHKLREEAQELLLKAEKLFYNELKLPILNEENIQYFGGESGKTIKAFICESKDLNLRLDAHCHMPIIKKLVETMRANLNGYLIDLKEIIHNIFIPTRFKRIYVKEPEKGIPFLQGSHIPLIKPFDLKYLWKKTEGIEKTLLARDWVLLTRSGTVGKTAIVTSSIEGWGASEHILRIITKPEINPGYLLMFLSSIYGNFQVLGKIYGGVVNEIAEKDISLLEKIKVLIPHEEELQKEIGNQVREAYEKKDQANILEEETIKLLERKLEEAAK
jgi:type I restriction enzyme S subunit